MRRAAACDRRCEPNSLLKLAFPGQQMGDLEGDALGA